MNTENMFLTVKDVATILQIGVKGSYKLFKNSESNGFPARIIGNKYIVGADAFRAWLNRDIVVRA